MSNTGRTMLPCTKALKDLQSKFLLKVSSSFKYRVHTWRGDRARACIDNVIYTIE